MAVATARVPVGATVPWRILYMVIRLDREEITTECCRLTEAFRSLAQEVIQVQQELDALHDSGLELLREADGLAQESRPLWDDSYNLCGDPACFGECRVCQEGEEDYEDDTTEKYCRRGRR